MLILNKFENVKIENTNRISEEDKNFCEIHNKAYEKTLNVYKQTLNHLIELYNEQIATLPDHNGKIGISYNLYVDMYGDIGISKIVDTIQKLQEKFISKICYYFSNKYNVTIESNDIYAKYKSNELKYEKRENKDHTLNENLLEYKYFDYNNIIDEIFEQLGGFTFKEKAIDEIKNATREIYSYNDYRKSSNMNIKNNKLIIDGYYAYKDSIWNEYRLTGDYGKIFTSLYYFDSNTIVTNNTELHNKYCGYENEKNQNNFEKYNPYSLAKVKSIKFYKNGKLEIEFKNSEDTQQFAKEYCGYINKVA